VSDEKPGDEDERPRRPDAERSDSAGEPALTDEQIDAETPGVDDAAELEAAEDQIADEAEQTEDKVVSSPTRRRRGGIVADGDEDEDEDGAPRARRRASSRPGGATAATRPGGSAITGGTRSRADAERARAAELAPRRSIGRFLREVVAELRKVIWPGRRELITYTTVVIIFVAVMVAIVAGLDVLFAQGVLAVFG
jgi:preprotein translocase subunit SecE